LQASSRDTLDTVSRSILLDDYAPVIAAVQNGDVWKNNELNVDYPAYAAGIYRENNLIMLIFLWHANAEQRTLYYVNLFKILCDLAQMSLLRAYDYSLALYEKQYIPETRIMKAQYFEECIENYMALSAKKVSTFVMLEIETNGHTPEEINQMIGNKVRTTDIIGFTSEGKLQIILPQASQEDLQCVLPRFEGLDIQVRLL
jgi:UDP-glucose 4-epimerase